MNIQPHRSAPMEPAEWMELRNIRRHLHQYPELGTQEYQTMEYICQHLEQWGIPFEKGIADTGVVALIEGDGTQSGPCRTVALRADIDALPIQEENPQLPYCSQHPGVMHACGHDVHTTIALGTARRMQQLRHSFSGAVKVLFQPAEELIGGAERMIQAGCLESPHVDCILGLHVDGTYPAGHIGVRYGKMQAASDVLLLKVFGSSAHGAQPHKGTDAIIVTASILTALQTLVSRRTSPTDPVVCTFGTIHGGKVRNQIADYVEAHGILRTLTDTTRCQMKQQLIQLCEGISSAMNARAELTIEESYRSLINTDWMVDVVKHNAELMLGADHVTTEQEPQMGTEDFAYFAAARPACFFHLGCALPQGSIAHNCHFDVDEQCIATGVELQTANLLSLLCP